MRKKTGGRLRGQLTSVRGRLLAILTFAIVQLGPATSSVFAQSADDPDRPLLTTVGGARATRAWDDFCRRLPFECAVDPSEPATISLDRGMWRKIVATNRRVNAAIRPSTDRQHWGVEDRWDYPDDGVGDCEDYQLLKRKLLIEAGVPRRALRMTVVIDEAGQGHAVLMLRSDRGEFILDNKRNAILRWHQTGYVYVKREGDASTAWVSLGDRTSPIVTANR